MSLTCASPHSRRQPVGRKLGLHLAVDPAGVASSTRGFVGDTVFAVLPNVKPIHCFVLTIAFQVVRLPALSAVRPFPPLER